MTNLMAGAAPANDGGGPSVQMPSFLTCATSVVLRVGRVVQADVLAGTGPVCHEARIYAPRVPRGR
jgi:hypothetical protein